MNLTRLIRNQTNNHSRDVLQKPLSDNERQRETKGVRKERKKRKRKRKKEEEENAGRAERAKKRKRREKRRRKEVRREKEKTKRHVSYVYWSELCNQRNGQHLMVVEETKRKRNGKHQSAQIVNRPTAEM